MLSIEEFKDSIGGVYSPISYKGFQCMIGRGSMRVDEDQYGKSREKLCKICGDWWPYDTEFWHAVYKSENIPVGLFSYCKACKRDEARSRGTGA